MKLTKEVNSARFLIIGYLGIIIIGAILLYLPFTTNSRTSFIDALFTSSSAICVTGLIVKDTALDFTIWGKLIILALIQIGGLGYMTLSTTFFYFLGKKVSLRDRIMFKESANLFTYENLMRFAWRILRITIIVELAGAIILYINFSKHFAPLPALGHSIFHAVSAFCNAGFSTFSNNLSNYSKSYIVPLTCIFLIITGGIGFLAISDIYYVLVKKAKKELALHTKIVLKTTAIFIILGTAIIFLLEGRNSLLHFSLIQKFINAFFHAVTPRTAGFNMINISSFSYLSIIVIMIFMFIGASPGGTGGGVKTTSFALILVWAKELFFGRYGNGITLMKKRVPVEQAFRAFLLIFSSIFLIFASFFIIMLIDQPEPFKLLFEVFSAFGTVGLSFGSNIKPSLSFSFDLSAISKLIIIFIMLSGRVGTLTLSHALLKPRPREFTYPEESIVIG
ncbi:MAG: TrkH family potassium uptake protein [bacterium]